MKKFLKAARDIWRSVHWGTRLSIYAAGAGAWCSTLHFLSHRHDWDYCWWYCLAVQFTSMGIAQRYYRRQSREFKQKQKALDFWREESHRTLLELQEVANKQDWNEPAIEEARLRHVAAAQRWEGELRKAYPQVFKDTIK